jgi:anti-sigma28 factor (negative regulator of flagellin synthesis)
MVAESKEAKNERRYLAMYVRDEMILRERGECPVGKRRIAELKEKIDNGLAGGKSEIQRLAMPAKNLAR